MQEARETEEGSQGRRRTYGAFSLGNTVPGSAWYGVLAWTLQHNSLQLVWSAQKPAELADHAECSHLPRRKVEVDGECCAVGTEGASRPRDARSCSPNLSQEDTRASNEKGSPRLGSTHSQSNAASPRAAASPSSKASEDEAQSGSRGSEAGSAQPSGGKATPAKQEATSPATAPGSGIASDDNGSGKTCAAERWKTRA